ncbi:RAMP superfamily CRISPR-associated protein [Desulfonatronovibrio magnus]|uniref:RAMP superfamily CRISPR-associated protein n=1 Tax=Desulfonatronovibrio magnus TaxID=698827 RepID=UPI0005EB5F56|nr:RAMP superfamily CRISPR-associated protein [Desulfonatronovibrio magnus]
MTFLQFKLLSDACFSSGMGFAGEVDTDIDQETDTGLPTIRGRTIKGLLLEECTLLLNVFNDPKWLMAAHKLFGKPGQADCSYLKVSNAYLPAKFRQEVHNALNRPKHPLSKIDILHSLTSIRYQTRISYETGAPQEHSLRSTRLALKGLEFYSQIFLPLDVSDVEKALIAGCVLSLRRCGLNRNRGWGRTRVRVIDNDRDVTADWAANLQINEGGSK